MIDSRRFRLLDVIPFVLVLATAAGARVGYLITYADNAASNGPLLVQDASATLDLPPGTEMNGSSSPSELDALVHNISEYHWFGSLAPFADQEEQTAHTSPGYPWLVGELKRLLPADTPIDSYVRWLQCLLGILTAGLYYLVARRAFPGRTVAVLTGLLCALHPFWIIATPALADGVLATFLLALCLWLGVRGGQVGGALTSLFFGLALAALALVRAELLPFAFVALLWFLRHSRRVSGGWQLSLLALLGFVIGLAPWVQRNVQAFGDVFPIVDSAYLHLWIGNNPKATGGPLTGAEQRAALPDSLAGTLARESQPARYRLLGQEAVADVQRDPAAVLERRLWAGLDFFFGEDWFTHKRLWRPAGADATSLLADSPYPALLAGSLLLMLVLGVLGWRWTYLWRRETRPLALALSWVPLPYLLSHAEALSGPRLPLDGVLLCFSAFVLACLAPNIARVLLRPRASAAP